MTLALSKMSTDQLSDEYYQVPGKKRQVYFHYISLLQRMRKYISYISCHLYFIDQENFCLFICGHICPSVHFI